MKQNVLKHNVAFFLLVLASTVLFAVVGIAAAATEFPLWALILSFILCIVMEIASATAWLLSVRRTPACIASVLADPEGAYFTHNGEIWKVKVIEVDEKEATVKLKYETGKISGRE